ncbi:MAG: hypothetical protein WCG78_03240 [Candidatus Omnitrophota bacterium]
MTRNLKFFSLLFMTAMKNRVENQWSAKSLPSIFLILLLILFGCEHGFSREVDSDRVLIMIISRPIEKKNELIPNNAQGARHLAIFSDILPHGVWEAGPGLSGMIETTGTVDNLVEWSTHRITQKCAEMGGEYLYSASAEVNKKSLLDSIRLYESTIAKKQKYDY